MRGMKALDPASRLIHQRGRVLISELAGALLVSNRSLIARLDAAGIECGRDPRGRPVWVPLDAARAMVLEHERTTTDGR